MNQGRNIDYRPLEDRNFLSIRLEALMMKGRSRRDTQKQQFLVASKPVRICNMTKGGYISGILNLTCGMIRVTDQTEEWESLQPLSNDIHTDFGDPCSSRFIARSLQECLEEHSPASEPPQVLPHRVVEILSARSIRLVQTQGQRGRYTTLSHRWSNKAKTAPLKTHRNNLQEHFTSIPFDELSPVFRDAIITTHMLGIKYIWIDSLCIIQGDAEDWVTESAKMSSIYGGSTLTLFATSTQGLLLRRKTCLQKAYHYSTFSGHSAHTLALSPLKHATLDSFSSAANVALFKRGWVFQERLLSRRAVVFGADELLWCCDHGCRCECMPNLQDPVTAGHQYLRRNGHNNFVSARYKYRSETQQDIDERSSAEGLLWLRLAEIFSMTRLTVETDRLPALSGLAKQRHGQIPTDMDRDRTLDGYLAGCWRHELMESLLWHSNPPRRRHTLERIDMRRYGYIAPSWTWLSLPHFVNFSYLSRQRLMKGRTGVEVGWRDLTKIEEARCKRATADPTGSLEGGHLTLSGPSLEAILTLPERGGVKPEPQGDGWTEKVYGDDGSVPYSEILASGTPAVEVTWLLLRCFLDRWLPPEFVYCEIGLILVPSRQHAECFERVGFFNIKHAVANVRSTEQQSRSTIGIFGIQEEDKTNFANFEYFFKRLQSQGIDLPFSRDVLLPKAVQRRLTVV